MVGILKVLALPVLAMQLFACSAGSAAITKKTAPIEGEGVGSSTVLNGRLMEEQNAVTPAELYRNVPGVSR